MEYFIILLFFAAMVGLIFWAIKSGRPGAVRARVDRPPRDVVQAAVQSFTARGWTTTSRTGRNATFSRNQSPGCGIVIVLFLFGIIPGLIYWVAAKRSLVVSVLADGVPGRPGQADLQINWNRNGGGRGPSLDFLGLVAPGATVQVGTSPAPNVLAEQWEEATDGALSGAQMRRMQASSPNPSAPAPVLMAGSSQAGETSAASPAPAPRTFCGYCGNRLDPGAAFCGACGNQVLG